jgi:hypothetical protein
MCQHRCVGGILLLRSNRSYSISESGFIFDNSNSFWDASLLVGFEESSCVNFGKTIAITITKKLSFIFSVISLEDEYVITKQHISYLILETVANMIVVIPLLWQAITIESLLENQIEQTSKANIQLKQQQEFLRKVCHVNYTFLLTF